MDAKRAFHNRTGLGNYSRSLIDGLAQYYPNHEYFLFNPKPSTLYNPPGGNFQEVRPRKFLAKLFPSLWRSSWITSDISKLGMDLYHGLSHEIPFGMKRVGIPAVVTIHDLIFEKYPKQFPRIDARIYSRKARYACSHAARIIAISEQTKRDIIDIYKTDPQRISVCYQSCNPVFANRVSEQRKQQLRDTYGLPGEFFLYVGSIIERKNLLNICEAMKSLKGKLDIPLVVVGNGKEYKAKVKSFLTSNEMNNSVIFLSENERYRSDALNEADRFAAIYQMSIALIYPSYYEGFGIPVLEALWSQVPVITSNSSCLPETGGDAAYYVDPSSSSEIATAMERIYSDSALRESMIHRGLAHAQNFTLEKCTAPLMNVYEQVLNEKSF